MTADRHARVGAIFAQARRLAAGERATFLGQATAGDTELRGEVESLLAEHEESSGFLDTERLRQNLGAIAAESIGAEAAPMPARIGPFRIVGIIGEGGMGIVYEAEQDDPKRRVALKVVRPGMVTRGLLQRFRHESQVLGQLRHPGIAQIYQAGTADEGTGGQPYFAMELISGRPLLEHAKTHDLGVRKRLELIARVCDALQHAHQKGVVHRDLKPANILVEDDGQPKVLDFGVARATDADIQTVTLKTDIGQLVGTLPYMSPEQASGDPARIDIRSDVYSLGVVTYELLTGRLPYPVAGKMVHEAVRVIQEEDPTRLSSIDRSLRGDVETILAKALAKEKERRYQSAAEFATDIRYYLADRPITARPASALYQLRKFARRNKALVGGSTVGITVAFIALIGATVYSLGQARLAKDEAYRSSIAAAESALAAGDPTVARQLLDATRPELRNWEWRYFDARFDQAIALFEPDEPIAAAALGAEGNELIILSTSGVLRFYALFSGTSRADVDLDLDGPLAAAVFSRDARFLATVQGPEQRTARVWTIGPGETALPLATLALPAAGTGIAISSGGERVVVAMDSEDSEDSENLEDLEEPEDSKDSEFIAWDPRAPDREPTRWEVGPGQRGLALDDRGDTIAFIGGFPGLHVHDVAMGKQRWALRQPSERAVAISPDGLLVATGGADKRIRIHETATAAQVLDLSGHGDVVRTLSFSPDGRRLASGGDDLTLRVWDVASGRTELVLTGHRAPIQFVRFSADGARLHSLADDGVRVWNVEPVDPTVVLHGHAAAVAFSPDGDTVYSGGADGTFRVWEASSGAARGVVSSARESIVALAVSPDGGVLAVGHTRGGVVLWNTATLEPFRELVGHSGSVAALSFSPDGKRLVSCSDADEIFTWDPATGERLLEAPGTRSAVIGVSFAPDGRRMAATTTEGVRISDVGSGKTIRTIAVPAVVQAVAWSPDGNWIAAGAADHAVRIFDAGTGALRHVRRDHAAAVYAVEFSPDSTRLASGSDDTTIRIWDVAAGTPVARLRGQHDIVWDLAFSPDGRMLVSASSSIGAYVWDTAPVRERWRVAARSRAASPLIPALDLAGDPFDGFCLEFDGALSHVLVGASEAFRFEASFTVEAWIRPLVDVPPRIRAIVNKEGEYQISLGNDGRFQYTIANSSSEGWHNWQHLPHRPPADAWTHVALVYAPEGVRAYINGQLAGMGPPPGPLADYHALDELRIGGRQWGDPGFRGLIDEVRIWSVARRGDDIHKHMLEPLRSDEDGLIGYWRFDGGRGETAVDETGRHDAAIIGATWQPQTHTDSER